MELNKKVKLLSFVLALELAMICFISGLPEIKGKPDLSNKTHMKMSSSYLTYLPISFSVLGDIHTSSLKLEKAIKDLYSINPKADVMVLNGDIVDQGLDGHYSRIQACLHKNRALLPSIVIKNIGNHEYFDYSKGVNPPSKINEYISKYLAFSNEKKVYHDVWVKGYHFISLGSEQCNTQTLGNRQAFISEDQQEWLREKLAEKYEPGKPIFVFLHQHIAGNEKTTSLASSDIKQVNEVKSILSKYPEAILFTSHTHCFLKSNNLLCFHLPFTAIHTGAVNNPVLFDGKGKRIFTKDSHGLYIEIKKNQITIKGRNLNSGYWIQGGTFSRSLQQT
jgi:3',5'-cyclic-AMP phosphodiesterase